MTRAFHAGSQHGGDILKNYFLGIQKEKQLMRWQMISQQ